MKVLYHKKSGEQKPGVMACTCNAATLEAKFRKGAGSALAEDRSSSIVGWIA